MATTAVAQAAAPEEQTGFFSKNTLYTMLQMGAIYAASQIIIPRLIGATPKTGTGVITPPTAARGPGGTPPVLLSPLEQKLDLVPFWPAGSLLDFHLQLSTAEAVKYDPSSPFASVTWEGIEYGSNDFAREWVTEWNVPESVQNNGSFYLDVFITRTGVSPSSVSRELAAWDATASPEVRGAHEVHHFRKVLTRYQPLRKIRTVKNLISGSSSDAKSADEIVAVKNETVPIMSYYHPNVTLQLVAPGPIVYQTLPPVLKNQITLAHKEAISLGKGFYYPLCIANDFWLLNSDTNPVNQTTTVLPLRVSFTPSSYLKFQIFSSLDEAFAQQSAAMSGGGELDEVKRMLTETSAWLLITTFAVSLLHILFSFLAFSSDVAHWRTKKELVGVSLRTIVTNVVVQLIILLYLMDNNENTSWMILGGQGMGLAIEAWKITKAVNINVVPTVAADQAWLPYRLAITDKHVLSEDELKTQVYDKLAFKYVVWGATPFLLAYAGYSLFYNEHRSYYSFVLNTLTSMVYSFGFIQLIPQLIINHKLKSVAHIPKKAMIYKFLNTIVDDLGAVIIKQPFLHKLAAFRDDVVFVVLIAQMFLYRTDYSRSNEYGQKLEADPLTPAAAAAAAVEGQVVESKKDI